MACYLALLLVRGYGGDLADSFSCAGDDDGFAFGDAPESGFGVDGRVDVMVEF